MTSFRLIWPPAQLSPNARVHWAERSRVAKQYRTYARAVVRTLDVRAPGGDRIELRLDFYPPDKRRRDDDNLIAAFKSARDGIADALSIDDNRFVQRANVHKHDPDPRGQGFVQVTLEAAETLMT